MWVLLVITTLCVGSDCRAVVTMQEFSTHNICNAAKIAIQNNTRESATPRMVCIQK